MRMSSSVSSVNEGFQILAISGQHLNITRKFIIKLDGSTTKIQYTMRWNKWIIKKLLL